MLNVHAFPRQTSKVSDASVVDNPAIKWSGIIREVGETILINAGIFASLTHVYLSLTVSCDTNTKFVGEARYSLSNDLAKYSKWLAR